MSTAANRAWEKKHPEKAKKHRKDSYNRARKGALKAYGEKCRNCGSSEHLQIDHIAEVLGKDRPNNLVQWLKARNYPPGFQTLCRRCNLEKFRHKFHAVFVPVNTGIDLILC